MAIVINGSGTVTGISVGGLPDGVVDAGTLADNAVGLAQMAGGTDGNVITYDASGNPAVVATGTAGHFLKSAGAGAAPTMAVGGKILQIVATSTTAQNSSTNTDLTAYSDIGLSVDITPLSSTSRFLITCTIGRGAISGGHNTWGGILFRDTTKIGNGADVSSRYGAFFTGVINWNGDGNHGGGTMNSYWNTTTGTAGVQITFKVGGFTEGSTMYINRNSLFSDGSQGYAATASSTITVMEVEA